MFLIIKDNKEYINYKLDKNSKIEYKDINIYYKNNNYYINLKGDSYFSDNTKTALLELKQYNIKSNNLFYEKVIYVYKNDEGINNYRLYKNANFVISDNQEVNIISTDPYLKGFYLSCINGSIKCNYDFSINGNEYNGDLLKEGDHIRILGIDIIWFKEYLYINSFNNISKLKEYVPEGQIVKYKSQNNHSLFNVLEDEETFKLEDLIAYKPIKKINKYDFIKSILPNMVMVISTSSMAILGFYSQVNNNQLSINSYSYLIMPLGMIFTGLLFPIVFYLIEKSKNSKDYLNSVNTYIEYLDNYSNRLEGNIKNYLLSKNNRYFDLSDINSKMFIANRKTKDFLLLSIGKINCSIEFKYELTGINQIDTKLENIKNKLNKIDDYPLFLDLKENKTVTIITKKSVKYFFFNKVLIELTYKHHYDDISIAIYSKDNTVIDNLFNLPHLFFNNKRLTINSTKQLIELDQSKIDKPLILLLYDYNDYRFNNKNIYCIYFSNEDNNILKDSDSIIKYDNNKGYLFKNNRVDFVYYENHIDFNKYYRKLGKLNNQIITNKIYTFKDFTDSKSIFDNYNSSQIGLKAYFSYSQNELLCLDLHESKHGPHGLIGGSTGSGKSELIVSFLLSLCIKYRPDYLNIVLIDYKGGGIKESLSYGDRVIPHVVASISNLDGKIFERLIISLKNECKERQTKFKELSIKSRKSIMNIDDYLSCSDNKLAHLVIVVDEFAELKKENPELIKELISISRIGRSLGIHLILATQKPAGVIDDEIWSNSRFKIALKVFEEKDSQDIIKCKDAAYLTKTGSFLLQVDDNLIKAQSIYSKTDINGNDAYIVDLLDNNLQTIKTYKKDSNSIISESTYTTKQIIDISNKLNIKTHNIDFYPNEEMDRKLLVKNGCIPFGEIDDYINNKRSLLAYSLQDSILIYSSRNHEINSILNVLNENHVPTIVIANNIYQSSYISDSVTYDDEDGILYIFNYLLKDINNRATLVIEDLSCLLSYNDQYSELLYKLVRRANNIHNLIIITKNCQIGFKIINTFKNKIMININDNSDLSSFYGCRSKYKGNSFYFDDEPICFVPIKIERFNQEESLLKCIIKRIPENIIPEIKGDEYLLGYDMSTREKIFSKEVLITSYDECYLNVYKKHYPKGNIIAYNHELSKKYKDNILWLGSGIYSQRLININNNKDLESNEAIYFFNNKRYYLRGIDNE